MTDNKNFMKLLSWIKEGNGTLINVKLFNDEKKDRGVYSPYGIRNNKTIVKIPRSLIIHDGMGQNSYYGRLLLRGPHSSINNLQIALVVIFILGDMQTDRTFLPYYNILPKKIGNFPIFWNDKVLTLLKGSDMLNKIKKRRRSFANDYEVIIQCCPGFQEEFSFKEFLLIRTLVGSRNFGIRIDGIKRVAMIPLSDMLNHDMNPNIKWYYDNNKAQFIMKTNSSIPGKVELTDTYGNKCNSMMLLFYGFALPNNKHNQLTIKFIHRPHRTRSERKKASLYCELHGKLYMGFDDLFAYEMFTFLRISAANESELSRFEYRRDYSKPISLRNEVEMLRLLHNYMTTLANNYILSLSKITEIIENIGKNSQEYLALLLIQGELIIIHFFIDMAKYVISQLKRREIPIENKYSNYTSRLYNIISSTNSTAPNL